MKKLYYSILSLICISTGYAQNGQIQNGGFENWSNVNLYDYTTTWGCSNTTEFNGVATTLRSTDAQIGTYSAEIVAAEVGSQPDTTFGYVYHGSINPGGGGPDGGISYTNAFDQVKFQYKSALPIGDTMYLLVIRFDALGAMSEMYLLPAAFGTHSSWTQGSVMVPANSQTTLFLGFVMGDPFSSVSPTPGAWARIDNVQMFNGGLTTTNVPDPSFEAWSTKVIEEPNNWFTMNGMIAPFSTENTVKSTSSNSGTYAAELTTIQFPPVTGDTIPGVISVGPIVQNGMNPFVPVPYTAIPTTFSGSYDYSPIMGDQGSIQAIFFASGLPIGSVSQTCIPTMGYSNFSLPITIVGTPDSIILIAFSGNKPGSVLLVDDLALSGGNVGIDEFEKFDVSIYPNPATDVVMIKSEGVYSYEIVDLTGKTVRSSANNTGAQSIDISDLSRGAYLVKLNNANGTQIHPLVVE